MTRYTFSALFKVGDIVESGVGTRRADAAHLEILDLDEEFIRYKSLKSKTKNRIRYSYLGMLVDAFDELDDRAIQKSVNRLLKKNGFSSNYSTENYAYTLAKAFVERANLSVFLSGGESAHSNSLNSIPPQFKEGSRIPVWVERIERDRNARQACIQYFGTDCQVCGMNFEVLYGQIGRGFIHVHHHRNQIAHCNGEQPVNPLEDLIPVCPNCHAMIHSQKEMLTLEQTRQLLSDAKKPQHRGR